MLFMSASLARAQVLGDPVDVSQDFQKFVADQKQQGFHISLWQYTYFASKNDLWKEMVAKGYTSGTRAVSYRSRMPRST